MNQIIKSRIEEINRGKIPEGYKKTAVGLCPREWEEHTLSDFLIFKNGLNKEKSAFGSGVPIVNYTDVWKKRGLRATDIKGRVQLSQNEIKNHEVKEGDVFFTRTSETIDEIGFSSVLLDHIENVVFSGFILRGRPYNDMVVKEYNQYCYSSDLMRNEIKRRSSITTRALTSGTMLSEVAINLPSKTEQARIAEILMKWDEMVELQEQYIQKLEQREHSVIKTTINSVIGESKKIKECVSYHPSSLLIKNLKEDENGFPVYGANDITMHISTYSFECDAVAIIKYGSSAGKVSFLTGKHSVLGTMAEMLPKKNINIKYIYYVLKCFNFKRYIEISTTPNVYFEDYAEEIIQVPSKNVQDRIVKELDIFTEYISLQKEKFERIKTQRKALQQYLLNGIVRVEV